MAEQNTSGKNSSVKLWLRGLLLVSLGVNVAIAGLAVGALYRFGTPSSEKRPPRGDEIAGTYTRALNSEDRRAIARQLRSKQQGAQYALIRGYGFARHVRTNVNEEGGIWTGDAVYTISPALPRGLRTIDAEVTVADCASRDIPTV